MSEISKIRELADRLVRRGDREARLTAASAQLAIVALRVYADLIEQPAIDREGRPFHIEEVDSSGTALEVLAIARNALIAGAAYEEALRLRPGRAIRLSQGARVLKQSRPVPG